MRYKIYYEEDKKLKNITLEAYNIQELKNNTSFPKNVIRIKEIKELSFNYFNQNKEKLELFYELKIMLNSNLNIEEVIDILLKSNFNKQNTDFLQSVKYALDNGQKIHEIIRTHEKYLGSTIILFFKIASQNLNMKISMNSLYEILSKNSMIREKLISALSYPLILLVSLFFSMYIIFYYVLPRFEYIFEQFGSTLPLSTSILLSIKDILDNHLHLIILSLFSFFILFRFLYFKFEIIFDKIIIVHIPVFSKMYRYILFYRLFLSINLIVKSKYNFYDALYSSKDIIKNKYFLSKITYILKDIKNGIDISTAFKNTNMFDNTTIRLLQTAQKSNKLDLILDDIVNIYDEKLVKSMKKFKLLLEPILIFTISFIVLWLVLAIMTPIWDLGTVLK